MLHLQLLRYFLIIVAASTSVISIDTNVRTIILFVYSCETFFGQNQNIFFSFSTAFFLWTPSTFQIDPAHVQVYTIVSDKIDDQIE